jgi:NADPH:quinone reductase-like Zn-dependent oxidoreductase
MKAYHLDQFDSLEGIVAHEDPMPLPGPKEAVVRVRARSLNYRDLLILHKLYPLPAAEGIVPLSDGAGEVVSVGEGTKRVSVGDRVAATYFPRWRDGRIEPEFGMEQFGCTHNGMLAEFFVADEQALVKVPEHLTFEEAATLPCAGVTAWSALNGPRRVLAGENVLTIGTGGVALFALQFAKIFGARTIAITSSAKKVELLRRLGADEVIDYRQNPDWHIAVRALTGGRGVDHIVETGSVDTLPKSLATCAWNAEVALVLALMKGTIDVAAMRGLYNARRLFVGSRASFEAMNRAITQHKLRPVIDRVFAFTEARAAYEHFEAKRHVGKVVIAEVES